jgi:hypothetical protein
MVLSMGVGCILATSTKQKSVSKSSTEASELITLIDMAGEGMLIQNTTLALTGDWL